MGILDFFTREIPETTKKILDYLKINTSPSQELQNFSKNISPVYKPDLKQSVEKVKQASDVAHFGLAKDVFVKYPARAAQSVVQSFTGDETITPQTEYEKIIFGTDPIQSLQARITETQKTLETGVNIPGFGNVKAPKGTATPLAIVGVIGMTALDLTPFGGEKNALKALSKATKAEDVAKVLKDLPTAKKVAPEIKPLAQEARKYNSAEEFINYYSKNVKEIPTTPEYQKYLLEQENFSNLEAENWVKLQKLTDKYKGISKETATPAQLKQEAIDRVT
jgi:hypothetical protein